MICPPEVFPARRMSNPDPCSERTSVKKEVCCHLLSFIKLHAWKLASFRTKTPSNQIVSYRALLPTNTNQAQLQPHLEMESPQGPGQTPLEDKRLVVKQHSDEATPNQGSLKIPKCKFRNRNIANMWPYCTNRVPLPWMNAHSHSFSCFIHPNSRILSHSISGNIWPWVNIPYPQ